MDVGVLAKNSRQNMDKPYFTAKTLVVQIIRKD